MYELSLKAIKKAVFKLPMPWQSNDTGRPSYNPRVVVFMCTVKEMFCHTYDSVESETRNDKRIKDLLRVDELPSHSVVHRGMKKLTMKYLRELNKRLTIEFRRKGIAVAADSSGFRSRNSSLWYDIRIKRKNKKKDWLKLHIVGCVDNGIIHNFKVTNGMAGDSPQLKGLLTVFKKLAKLVADSGYLSRKNCDIVEGKGGKVFIKLKCTTTARAKRSRAWRVMVMLYKKNSKVWLDEYHVRSIVESIFSSIKKRFGSTLRSMKKSIQKKELALKVIVYNIKQILYVKTARKLGVGLYIPVK